MKRILLKIGGRAFSDNQGFVQLAAAILSVEADIIIVHGGGTEISQALKDAHRETLFINGVRVTQKEDVEIVEHVLSNMVNSRIAQLLQENGVKCLRLSGKTKALLVAKKTLRNGKDIGYVGEIVRVNPEVVFNALDQKLVPIVSPISADETETTFNVNADTAASALAIGTSCTDLVYFSDVSGVMDKENCVIPDLEIGAAKFLINTGIISGGMVAKMESIFDAITKGVEKVHITNWQGKETLKHLLDGKEIIKTTIHG